MERPNPIRVRYFILLPLLIALIVVVLVLTKPERKAPLRELPSARVQAIKVQQRDLEPVVQVAGRLRPQRSTQLHFELSGQVKERLVEPGQQVAAGQPLLSLHEGDFADALALAKAQWQQEQAAVARDRQLLKLAVKNRRLQENEVERLKQLGSASLASQTQLGEARQRLLQLESEEARLRYAVETAEARLSLREAERSRAQRNLERTRLQAPFSGVINQVAVQVGDYVSPNQRVLELIDTDFLELHLEVSGASARVMQLGQTQTVRVAGRDIEGSVVALQQDPDATTYTHALRIRLPGEGLMPGALAQAALSQGVEEAATVVPVNAVLQEDGQAHLFVIKGDTLERRAVSLGRREGSWFSIQAGVQPGTLIVARDVAALSDGQTVVVKAEPLAGQEPG